MSVNGAIIKTTKAIFIVIVVLIALIVGIFLFSLAKIYFEREFIYKKTISQEYIQDKIPLEAAVKRDCLISSINYHGYEIPIDPRGKVNFHDIVLRGLLIQCRISDKKLSAKPNNIVDFYFNNPNDNTNLDELFFNKYQIKVNGKIVYDTDKLQEDADGPDMAIAKNLNNIKYPTRKPRKIYERICKTGDGYLFDYLTFAKIKGLENTTKIASQENINSCGDYTTKKTYKCPADGKICLDYENNIVACNSIGEQPIVKPDKLDIISDVINEGGRIHGGYVYAYPFLIEPEKSRNFLWLEVANENAGKNVNYNPQKDANCDTREKVKLVSEIRAKTYKGYVPDGISNRVQCLNPNVPFSYQGLPSYVQNCVGENGNDSNNAAYGHCNTSFDFETIYKNNQFYSVLHIDNSTSGVQFASHRQCYSRLSVAE